MKSGYFLKTLANASSGYSQMKQYTQSFLWIWDKSDALCLVEHVLHIELVPDARAVDSNLH